VLRAALRGRAPAPLRTVAARSNGSTRLIPAEDSPAT
jgi:hypothetical protein